jgi:hypothetical protein
MSYFVRPAIQHPPGYRTSRARLLRPSERVAFSSPCPPEPPAPGRRLYLPGNRIHGPPQIWRADEPFRHRSLTWASCGWIWGHGGAEWQVHDPLLSQRRCTASLYVGRPQVEPQSRQVVGGMVFLRECTCLSSCLLFDLLHCSFFFFCFVGRDNHAVSPRRAHGLRGGIHRHPYA